MGAKVEGKAMERITEKGVKSYLDLYDRLCDIEDILGEEYDLDQLRELTECMKKGARLIDANELEQKSMLELSIGDTVHGN